MIDQDEIFSGDDVLLLPSLEGVTGSSIFKYLSKAWPNILKSTCHFKLPQILNFFSEGGDTVLLDGIEKIALVSGENIDVVQAEGDSTIFITGTNINVDLEAGQSTLFWDGGADSILSLNVDGGSVKLVLPDRVLSPNSEVLLVDNGIH